jgi:hypothetical protein
MYALARIGTLTWQKRRESALTGPSHRPTTPSRLGAVNATVELLPIHVQSDDRAIARSQLVTACCAVGTRSKRPAVAPSEPWTDRSSSAISGVGELGALTGRLLAGEPAERAATASQIMDHVDEPANT